MPLQAVAWTAYGAVSSSVAERGKEATDRAAADAQEQTVFSALWAQRPSPHAPLFEDSFIAYVAEAQVGTPPQRKRFIVDTGSSALAINPYKGQSFRCV